MRCTLLLLVTRQLALKVCFLAWVLYVVNMAHLCVSPCVCACPLKCLVAWSEVLVLLLTARSMCAYTATEGVVIATEKKMPSALVDEASIHRVLLAFLAHVLFLALCLNLQHLMKHLH